MAELFRRRMEEAASRIDLDAERKKAGIDQEADVAKGKALLELLDVAGMKGFLPREVIKTSHGFDLAIPIGKTPEGRILSVDGSFYRAVQDDDSVPPELGEKIDGSEVVGEVTTLMETQYDESPASQARIKTYPGVYPVKIVSWFHLVKDQPKLALGQRGRPPAGEYRPAGNRQDLEGKIPFREIHMERIYQAVSPEAAVIAGIEEAKETNDIAVRVDVFMGTGWYSADLDAVEAQFAEPQTS